MRKHEAKTPVAPPWSHPIRVDDVPEEGREVTLTADAEARRALATQAGAVEIPELTATLRLVRHGASGLVVTGRVTATVRQTCVVTLEPLENRVDEPVEVVFEPPGPAAAAAAAIDIETELELHGDEPPEPLAGGVVDLGAVATEFLLLGIDPYPRKAGAVFEPPAAAAGDGGPFAALAALKKAPPEAGG